MSTRIRKSLRAQIPVTLHFRESKWIRVRIITLMIKDVSYEIKTIKDRQP